MEAPPLLDKPPTKTYGTYWSRIPSSLPPRVEETSCRLRTYEIIFGTETRAGRLFDISLLIAITLSIVSTILESVDEIDLMYKSQFKWLEFTLNLMFSFEYCLRIWCVHHWWRYALSFFGLIDLSSILPMWIRLLLPQHIPEDLVRALRTVRIFRLLRIFTIFGLGYYVGEAVRMRKAIESSSRKIMIFMITVLSLVTFLGTLIYLVEGEENGFTDIPTSIYWAIVTVTTVGYGDISPKTTVGKMLASVVMIAGYGILAVPTGLVTVEINNHLQGKQRQVAARSSSSSSSRSVASSNINSVDDGLPPGLDPTLIYTKDEKMPDMVVGLSEAPVYLSEDDIDDFYEEERPTVTKRANSSSPSSSSPSSSSHATVDDGDVDDDETVQHRKPTSFPFQGSHHLSSTLVPRRNADVVASVYNATKVECSNCQLRGHDGDAVFCKRCGHCLSYR